VIRKDRLRYFGHIHRNDAAELVKHCMILDWWMMKLRRLVVVFYVVNWL